VKTDENNQKPKANWIQLSKDKSRGIVYEIGVPEDYPPSQEPSSPDQS